MAHQDTAEPQLTDQPPAYPYNDKPPDYHDVCPRQTVSPPPVDIPPSGDIPPSVDIPISFDIPLPFDVLPRDNSPVRITPVYSNHATTTINTTTFTVTTTTARNPHENVVVTQSPTHNSHVDDADEGINWHNILWKILLVLSVIAAILALPLGLHACIHACIGYHSDDPEVQKRSAKVAIVMCIISYVAIIVVVTVVPAVLA